MASFLSPLSLIRYHHRPDWAQVWRFWHTFRLQLGCIHPAKSHSLRRTIPKNMFSNKQNMWNFLNLNLGKFLCRCRDALFAHQSILKFAILHFFVNVLWRVGIEQAKRTVKIKNWKTTVLHSILIIFKIYSFLTYQLQIWHSKKCRQMNGWESPTKVPTNRPLLWRVKPNPSRQCTSALHWKMSYQACENRTNPKESWLVSLQ